MPIRDRKYGVLAVRPAWSAAVCLILLFGAASRATAAAPQYSAEKSAAAITFKTPDGKPILRYVLGTLPEQEQPQTSVPVVGYLHPVYTPSGETLTESGHADGDHAWLRGVFLAWPQVAGPKPAGFWTCGKIVWQEKGQIVNREATTAADERAASLCATNAWRDGRDDVLIEKTTIHACIRSGVYVIDLESTLRASEGSVQLQPWAFAGWTLHGRRVPDERATFHTPRGDVQQAPPVWNDAASNWPDAPWYDLTLTGQNGTACGLAMLGHPDNGPTTWHANGGLRFLNPNVTPVAPITLETTKPLVLRYRLVSHDGSVPTETLNRLAAEFAEPSPRE